MAVSIGELYGDLVKHKQRLESTKADMVKAAKLLPEAVALMDLVKKAPFPGNNGEVERAEDALHQRLLKEGISDRDDRGKIISGIGELAFTQKFLPTPGPAVPGRRP